MEFHPDPELAYVYDHNSRFLEEAASERLANELTPSVPHNPSLRQKLGLAVIRLGEWLARPTRSQTA